MTNATAGEGKIQFTDYILAALLAVDFIITPGERWVSGIGLVGALVAVGGYGYQRFQDSKTRSKPIR
jgi:hypothetical protein